MQVDKTKRIILITSVGSLVGQNVLDSLENRRQKLFIIGTNSIAEAANNFRCDKSHLVSAAKDHNQLMKDFLSIIESEKPDLVIPGRDDDVVILSRIGKNKKQFSDSLLVGSVHFAEVMDDKVMSYQFALKHNLPFAPTLQSGTNGAFADANKLALKYGFPLIAKPSKGNGSRGIWVVTNKKQLEKVAQHPGFSIQPLFGRTKDLNLDTSFGLPFFWEIPENRLFAAQVIITREGKVEETFGFISKMVAGKCERMDKCTRPDLYEVVNRFANAAVLEGWRGPFNIQLKEDEEHGFQVIEMNGRFSGGTSARYHLGFDEVGRTLVDWIDDDIFPIQSIPEGVEVVTKILSDFEIKRVNVEELNKKRVWDSS